MSDHQLSVFQSAIRDNRERGIVGDFLKEKIDNGSKLSIVSAYFTIYAFEALKQELWSIDELDFLFGEPRFIQSMGSQKDYKAFKIEDSGINLTRRLDQNKLVKDCEQWIREKVNIRSIKQSNLLHGKMYHINKNGVINAILGSSNFTLKGLGLANGNNNIELNLVVDSDRDKQDLQLWFEQLWNNQNLVEDVKEEVISYLNKLYQDNAPEFIYYKTLYHLFKKFSDQHLASDLLTKQQHLTDTKIWNLLFDFQKDGVKGAINKIMEHNGCIIADSVGLGKTFEALAIIKYFELLNYKVLVLCPKKLRSNWTIYHASNNSELNILVEDRFNYTVLSHTDLSRESGYSGDINLESLNWSNYDLVVIDESHNFRNNTKGKRDKYGNIIKKSRYERLMEDIIKKGVPTRVLLLSATPVNTDLKDLRNQINFIVEDKESAFSQTLGIVSIKQTLKADYILANPPFNVSDWEGKHLREDSRWIYGTPPVGNANYAWIQQIISHLAPNGIAGFVLANGSMSSNQSGEGEIRKALIEGDLVDCMVALPGQLFYNTQIPACLWFLTRNKGQSSLTPLSKGGTRQRKGETLFIDARKLGVLIDRVHRELTPEEISRIADTYHGWRSHKGDYEDIPGFCKGATLEEIRGHGYVLTPGRYVGGAEVTEDDDEPFDEKMERLTKVLQGQFAESARLEAEIKLNLQQLGYEGKTDENIN